MLYVVFSFVFIKYVNDRFFAQPRGSLHPKVSFTNPRSVLLSHPARVTRSLQEVVSSFAVAKVYQIPNTNQIFPRKTSENTPQSCTHFPLNKTLTTMEKILRRRTQYPHSTHRDHPQVCPKIIRVTPFPSPLQPQRPPKTQPLRSSKSEAKGSSHPTPPCFSPSPPLPLPELSPPSFSRPPPRSNEAGIPSQPKRPNRGPRNALHKRAKTIIPRTQVRSYRERTCDHTESVRALLPRAQKRSY